MIDIDHKVKFCSYCGTFQEREGGKYCFACGSLIKFNKDVEGEQNAEVEKENSPDKVLMKNEAAIIKREQFAKKVQLKQVEFAKKIELKQAEFSKKIELKKEHFSKRKEQFNKKVKLKKVEFAKKKEQLTKKIEEIFG